jgi:hypothetical protein
MLLSFSLLLSIAAFYMTVRNAESIDERLEIIIDNMLNQTIEIIG